MRGLLEAKLRQLVLRNEPEDALIRIHKTAVRREDPLAHADADHATPQLLAALSASVPAFLNDRYVLIIELLDLHANAEPALACEPLVHPTVDLFVDYKSLPQVNNESGVVVHFLDTDI